MHRVELSPRWALHPDCESALLSGIETGETRASYLQRSPIDFRDELGRSPSHGVLLTRRGFHSALHKEFQSQSMPRAPAQAKGAILMTSKLFLGLLFGLVLVVGIVPQASADVAVAGPPAEPVTLTTDPFLDLAVVTTSVVQVKQCFFDVWLYCPYQPVGTDCADPAGNCHCHGANPATRICAGN